LVIGQVLSKPRREQGDLALAISSCGDIVMAAI